MGVTITEGTPVSGASDGTLLSLADAKAYLRIDGTTEDALIADLIADAEAFAEGYVGRLFTAAEKEERYTACANARGFRIHNWPISTTAALTVEDADGNDITDSFRVEYATGALYVKTMLDYRAEYVVTYTGGMSLAPTWERDALKLTGAIRDLVAEWYANRDPGASSVTDGDVSRVTASPVTGAKLGVPPRVLAVLDSFRGW